VLELFRTRKMNIFRTLDELAKVIYKNLLDLDAAYPGVCFSNFFIFVLIWEIALCTCGLHLLDVYV